jgi:hypothetical protein
MEQNSYINFNHAMNNTSVQFKLLVLILLVSMFSCATDTGDKNELIASVGERTIDWKLLKRSYHLDPKWGKGLTNKESYVNQLNFLIDQKLYAQAAIASEMENEENNLKYLTFLKEKEMIKELYRKEVESQIEITDGEYRSAYKKLKTKIKLAYITTPDKENADKYLDMINVMAIDDLALLNPNTDKKGFTPLFSFGEMAEEIDNVAFDLQLNETAGPLKIENRYMVIKLIDGSREKIFSELEFAESKSKIRQIIFDRKAGKLSNQYIFKLLKDENVKLNQDVFRVLVEHFNAIVQREVGENPLPVNLSDYELRQVQTKIEDIKGEVLVTFNDGQMTVQEFISRLFIMPAGIRPMVKMSQNLKLAIGIIVRDKYLAEKAYAEGIDKLDHVVYEVQWQGDQYLSKKWLSNLRAQISLSPDEIHSFLEGESYLKVKQRSTKDLTFKEVEDLLVDFKFIEAKMQAADSLRRIYTVVVDSTFLFSKIKSPDKIINENPIKLIYREKYN